MYHGSVIIGPSNLSLSTLNSVSQKYPPLGFCRFLRNRLEIEPIILHIPSIFPSTFTCRNTSLTSTMTKRYAYNVVLQLQTISREISKNPTREKPYEGYFHAHCRRTTCFHSCLQCRQWKSKLQPLRYKCLTVWKSGWGKFGVEPTDIPPTLSWSVADP